MAEGSLHGLFAPSRVAVIGATEREGSVGRALMTNLTADFEGSVIPINPNYETVFDQECYPDIERAPSVDLAVVAVPPNAAVEVIRQAGEAGVRNVVVITAGFGETGSEGAARERELVAVAEEYDLNLVGPNSLGIISTPHGLNATFGPENAPAGGVSFMSQSGAFITAVLDWAKTEDVGFKDVVSLGNKAVLDETDFIATWGADSDTDVILGYLEGIEDGEAFIRTAREVSRETPIVLVKSGRTEAGAQAVSSHTGTLAGSDRAYDAGLEQAGVIRAENVQELFDYAEILEDQPLPESEGVAIVTNAGGPGVMATDAVGDSRLGLASFTDETIESLTDALPEEANVYNPIDAIGDADIERFRTAIDIALADENVGAAIVLSAPTAVLEFDHLAEAIVSCHREHGKPMVCCLMGGERARRAEAILQDAGIPNYFDPARAVRSLDVLALYDDISQREHEPATTFDVDRERAHEILETVRDREGNRLGVEAMGLLDAYGIPTPRGEVVDDPAEAAWTAAELGDEVVMKIVSPDIPHKSDIGGVRVGVPREEVRATYEDLITRAMNYRPDATILGVHVQEQLDLDDAVETIIGMNRDPQFGPLLMFGLGGIFVEVLEDTTFRVAPISGAEAETMIDEIQSAPLLRGARGRDPVDRDAVVESLQRLSQLVTDFPAILELDVNPLVATADGVSAVDVRLTVNPDRL